MKRIFFAWIIVMFVASCTQKDRPKPLVKNPDLSTIDFIKSINTNYDSGKITIVYESGKTIRKVIPKDSIPPVRVITSQNSSKSAMRTLGGLVDEPITIQFSDGEVSDDSAPESAGIENTRMNVSINVRLERDPDTRIFTKFLGFYGNVTPPVAFYTASNGQSAVRTAEVMGITGFAGPIPGYVLNANWHYYINAVYRWESGFVFTRQYERSGSRTIN